MYSVSIKCVIISPNALIILLDDQNPRTKVNKTESIEYGITMTERLSRTLHGHNAAGDKAELDSHPLLPWSLSCQHPLCPPDVELEYDSTDKSHLSSLPFSLSHSQQLNSSLCIYYPLFIIYLEEND